MCFGCCKFKLHWDTFFFGSEYRLWNYSTTQLKFCTNHDIIPSIYRTIEELKISTAYPYWKRPNFRNTYIFLQVLESMRKFRLYAAYLQISNVIRLIKTYSLSIRANNALLCMDYLCVEVCTTEKSRRRRQFFLIFGRHRVNLSVPPPIFTSHNFAISGQRNKKLWRIRVHHYKIY